MHTSRWKGIYQCWGVLPGYTVASSGGDIKKLQCPEALDQLILPLEQDQGSVYFKVLWNLCCRNHYVPKFEDHYPKPNFLGNRPQMTLLRKVDSIYNLGLCLGHEDILDFDCKDRKFGEKRQPWGPFQDPEV